MCIQGTDDIASSHSNTSRHSALDQLPGPAIQAPFPATPGDSGLIVLLQHSCTMYDWAKVKAKGLDRPITPAPATTRVSVLHATGTVAYNSVVCQCAASAVQRKTPRCCAVHRWAFGQGQLSVQGLGVLQLLTVHRRPATM